MNKQSQWLFEVPVTLESDRYSNPHPEYYQHLELERQWEIPFVPPLPEEEWGSIQEWEMTGSSEYPKTSRFVPAKYYGRTRNTRAIRRIVIHITDGSSNINGTVSWFRYMLGKDSKPAVDRTGKLIKASAHYIIGQDGEVVQMVRENDVSYHAGSVNSDSIGIEHVARKPKTFSGTDKGLFPSQIQYCSSATVVRWLCQKYGIPMNRVHILGHAEADLKTSHKACPNSVWNWDYFMKLVTGAQPCIALPPTPPASPTPNPQPLPSPDGAPGKLVYEDKITENKAAFIAKVRSISAALSIKPDWLMALMNHESGLNHRIPNPRGGATGLIQFMPATARGLGTTTEALRSMSNVEQLDYVYKYFAPYRGRIRNYSDLYLITFYPYALGKPDSYVFGSERSLEHAKKITSYNKAMDLNKDGVITMVEFKQWIYQGISSVIRSRLM